MELLSVAYTTVTRYLLPLLGILIALLCARGLFPVRKPYTYARLKRQSDGEEYPLKSGEVLIGCHPKCDVCLTDEAVEKRHTVLTLEPEGFRVVPVKRGLPVAVNGQTVEKAAPLRPGDTLTIGTATLSAVFSGESDLNSGKKPDRLRSVLPLLFTLTVFQLLLAVSLMLHYADDAKLYVLPIAFGCVIAAEWGYGAARRFRQNSGPEMIGFFLTTLGLAIGATVRLSSLIKQSVAFGIGFAGFLVLCALLADRQLTIRLRYVVGLFAIGLFAYNLLCGVTLNGARNWVDLGPVSFQPSELLKVAYVFVCAVPLDHMLSTRNYTLFLAFSGICLGSLGLMHDFGTAAIYFVAMMVILGMRLTDTKTMLALVVLAAAAVIAIIFLMPYVTSRFASYRHAWELSDTSGYQQTRTMIAIASGGLFGLGSGNGNLVRVAAADTDLVFGVLCEEWGLLVALCAAACFVMLSVYAVRCTGNAHSAYYAIASCAVCTLFLFQITLNIFGSVDLLPLTGVTMPFVSNGGTSMIASWMLLAFVRTGGTRTVDAVLHRKSRRREVGA